MIKGAIPAGVLGIRPSEMGFLNQPVRIEVQQPPIVEHSSRRFAALDRSFMEPVAQPSIPSLPIDPPRQALFPLIPPSRPAVLAKFSGSDPTHGFPLTLS